MGKLSVRLQSLGNQVSDVQTLDIPDNSPTIAQFLLICEVAMDAEISYRLWVDSRGTSKRVAVRYPTTMAMAIVRMMATGPWP